MAVFAKNKKILIILTIVMVGVLFGGFLVVSAADDTNPIDRIGQAVAGWFSSKDLAKSSGNGNVIAESGLSFYELAYAKASDEQKEELDKIIADQSIDLTGEWRRPVLIAIGDLPKDMPRLSAEQAAELFGTKEIGDLESEFNKIAGAPDFIGGSGIGRSIYFLNDNRSESIIIIMQHSVYYFVNNPDGTQTRLPLGTQQFPANPGPSIKTSNPTPPPQTTATPNSNSP